MKILFKVILAVIALWFIIMFSFGMLIGIVVDTNKDYINGKTDCNLDYKSFPAVFFIPSQIAVAEALERSNLCKG